MKTLLKRERPGLPRIAALVLVMVLSIGTKAFATFEVEGIKYDFVDKTAKTVGVDQGGTYTGDVTIPATVTYDEVEYTVTEILENAFYNKTGLTSIVIPGSVTKIGVQAFYGCSSLTTVTLLNPTPPTFGYWAFYSCSSLTAICVPSASVKTYEETDGWSGYAGKIQATTDGGGTSANMCGDAVTWSVEGGVLMIEGTGAMYDYDNDSNKAPWESETFTKVVIGEGVTTIGNYAFNKCSGLTTLTIGGDVTSIGQQAFYQCSGLTSVTIPDGVKEIVKGAFALCSGLTSVTIGSGVTTIGAQAFVSCSVLKSVTIGEKVETIGDAAFANCTALTSVTIGEKVTSIGEGAFGGCSKLTSIEIPSSVTSIGASAFAGCTKLATVTSLATTTPTLGDDVFDEDVEKSATLVVPKGTKEAYAAADGWKEFTTIDDGTTGDGDGDDDKDDEKPDEDEDVDAGPDITEEEKDGTVFNFNYGDNMQEVKVTKGDYSGDVVIPETVRGLLVRGIEDGAFAGCTALEAVEIPRSVTTIGAGAFNGCSSLDAITIRSTVTAIGAGAFDGCTTLKKVIAEDIPAWCSINFGSETANPLVQAGHIYSDENTEITDLVIADNVERIGKYAFCGGIGLRSVVIGIDNQRSGLKSVLYYDGVKEIGDSAFYGCSNLISVTLRNSVEKIGAYAFSDCNLLDSVAIPSGVKAIGEKAFDCSDITTVVSHIEEPFAIDASAFSAYTLENGTLYVPDETLTKYKSTAGWKEFKHIVGKVSTGIEDIVGEKVTIRANSGALHIDGVKDGTRVVVYTMTGAKVGETRVAGGTATIPTGLRRGDIAIVRIGDASVKVMVQ